MADEHSRDHGDPPNSDEPAADDLANGAPADDTHAAEQRQAGAGPASTAMMPALGGDQTPPATWSARAQVRPRQQPGGGDDGDGGGWDSGDEDWDGSPPRNLLAPALIGLLALLLLGILAFGIWLVLHGQQGGASVPGPASPTPTVTPTRASSAPATTSAAPTSQPPQTPTLVEIPVTAGQGLDFNAASARLVALGFAVVRADRASNTVPAGQVIETDPPGGSVLPPGSTITIIVSTGAPTPTRTSTPSPSAPPTT